MLRISSILNRGLLSQNVVRLQARPFGFLSGAARYHTGTFVVVENITPFDQRKPMDSAGVEKSVAIFLGVTREWVRAKAGDENHFVAVVGSEGIIGCGSRPLDEALYTRATELLRERVPGVIGDKENCLICPGSFMWEGRVPYKGKAITVAYNTAPFFRVHERGFKELVHCKINKSDIDGWDGKYKRWDLRTGEAPSDYVLKVTEPRFTQMDFRSPDGNLYRMFGGICLDLSNKVARSDVFRAKAEGISKAIGIFPSFGKEIDADFGPEGTIILVADGLPKPGIGVRAMMGKAPALTERLIFQHPDYDPESPMATSQVALVKKVPPGQITQYFCKLLDKPMPAGDKALTMMEPHTEELIETPAGTFHVASIDVNLKIEKGDSRGKSPKDALIPKTDAALKHIGDKSAARKPSI